MRTMLAAVMLGCLASVQPVRAVPDEAVLMGAFMQTHLIHLASTQIDDWTDGQADPVVEELEAALDNWTGAFRAFSRKKLTAQFGDEDTAKARLTAFVSAFTQAEKKGDKTYLKKLSGRLELDKPWPADYTALRQAALQACLGSELDEASAFLGAVETWVDQKKKKKADTPSLEAWLDATLYNKKAAGTGGTAKKKAKPAPPADPLAAAEAGLGGFSDDGEEMDNPLDELRSSRAAKRKKAMEQARDGMASVARERAAAEQEVASKKMAAAQAEASALQAHADKLATVEKEALEQRQNSWTSRLKNIVATTISTATGVFFGSVGQRAGEAVTDAVFNNKK